MLARFAAIVLVLLLATSTGCDADGKATRSGLACAPARYYAIDRVDVPDRAGEAASLGLDLDGDRHVDNALGALIGSVRQTNPDIGDLDARVAARLATAPQPWLVGLSDCEDGSTQVEIGQSGGGDAAPLTALADPLGSYTPIAWVRAARVTARLDEHGDEVDGVIGFAVPLPAAEHALAAPFAAYLTAELRAGTSPLAAQTDADHDGVVTPEELLAVGWMRALLRADVAIEDGGAIDGLSCGVGVHARRVQVR